jgi:hypothetical protein
MATLGPVSRKTAVKSGERAMLVWLLRDKAAAAGRLYVMTWFDSEFRAICVEVEQPNGFPLYVGLSTSQKRR